MRKRSGRIVGSVLIALAMTQPGLPQGFSSSAKPLPATIQVVLSKGEGEKRVSLPYSLGSVSSGITSSLRIGAEVPVGTTDPNGQTRFTFQQIGTQIDYVVSAIDDSARYKVQITITRRDVYDGSQSSPTPAFYNFIFAGTLILRDGETAQITGTDIVRNETLRADVTLSVKK
jgi:hypothetical protein